MEWLRLNEEGEIEFVMEEVKLVPEVLTLLQWPYNKGYKGDTQGRKRLRAMAELKYMYLMYSPKSPYQEAYSEKERLEESKKDAGFSEHWIESEELQTLIKKYVKASVNRITRSKKIVERFLEKFEAHLESIDLNERTMNEGLVHKPGEIMKTLQELPRFLTTMQELEHQSRLGMVAAPTSKGDHELGWMAMNKDHGKRKREDVPETDGGDTEEGNS
jgi:hypothetical protein